MAILAAALRSVRVNLNVMHASTSKTALTAETLAAIEHWQSPEALAAHTIASALTGVLAPAGYLPAAATEVDTPIISPCGSSTMVALTSMCAGTARITRVRFPRIAGPATRNSSPALRTIVGAVVIGSTDGGRTTS